MKKFANKTLLVLGSNVGAVDIVKYAKDNGAYTIVADYYPSFKSEAKQIADEELLISTDDLEGLSNFISDRKIDGILAGISEFNLLNAMTLCEKFKLPFYCSRAQWNIVEKKDLFRELCKSHNVPCPKTYYVGREPKANDWRQIRFPAVIKPVDGSASAGVFICYDEIEMKKIAGISLEKSTCKNIIIEEFVEGEEFTAHYTVINGTVALSTVDNRYPVAVNEGAVTTVPIARVYPCLFLDEYLKQVNEAVCNMIHSLNLKNAIVFIQGLYNINKNTFYIFEGGLRSAGEAPYRFVEKINGINSMQVLVDNALGIPIEVSAETENPNMNGLCCGVISFVTVGGTVGKIEGLEEAVAATPSIIEYESRYKVGTETPNGNTLRQLMIRFVMICRNRECMAKDIAYLNEHISVLNTEGENMVKKMEPERLFGIK